MARDDLRPDIAAAKARMRTTLGSGKETKRLVGYLWEDERVERMTKGTYSGIGLLVLTDRRLLFIKEGLTKKTEDFPLEKVSSVQWSSGLTLGSITIFASGNKAEITNVNKADGKEMCDHVRHRLSVPKPPITSERADEAAAHRLSSTFQSRSGSSANSGIVACSQQKSLRRRRPSCSRACRRARSNGLTGLAGAMEVYFVRTPRPADARQTTPAALTGGRAGLAGCTLGLGQRHRNSLAVRYRCKRHLTRTGRAGGVPVRSCDRRCP
jgi:hypothetical protein